MFNFNRGQVVIFIFLVLLFLSKTCREYYENTNCSDIRAIQPNECTIMTQTECSEWANNMGKKYQPNNDVFCGVVDSCPVGCYVYNENVYYGPSTNIGNCSNQRICVQKNR